MLFCPSSSALDLGDPCVRAAWSALVPLGLVVLFVLYIVLVPVWPTFFQLSPLREFLSLEEAEALDHDASKSRENISDIPIARRRPLWFTIVLTAASLVETVSWLAVGAYLFAVPHGEACRAVLAMVFASTWLYATLSAGLYTSIEPPYVLFVLYLAHLVGASLNLGGVLFDVNVYGDALPPPISLAILITNVVVCLILVSLVLSRPFAVPSVNVPRESIGKNVSPEDYTTLWGWVSFSWVNALITKGTYETLSEDDVWDLSVTMRARPIFRKFSTLNKRRSLLWQIWAANSKDIVLDCVGTFISVFFNYLGPFFLKRIIDAIDNGTPAARSKAYVFAVLMLSSQILKGQADLQHLWYGRRASVRIRSQLMAAIYEKALKRKDFSGIVNKQEKVPEASGAKETKKEKKVRKEKENKSDEPKAGADIGKIVNLMAGDANRIAMIISGMYFLYGAPFEIFIASVFLYQLLGISAFAGFGVLILVWPLNNFLARRAVRIQKGVLVARDGRMAVINEVLSGIKFIKFFAWEERWIARTLEARQKELKWLVKSRFNSIMFQSVWSTAPIAVSVLSFLTYVVQGNELTVGTAFTAIALFSMIRAPLNVIPTWVVHILQTRIALQRIETFLNEDEVGPQVSTLKKDDHNEFGDITEFGLSNASFKWNAVEEKDKGDGDQNAKGKDKSKKSKTDPERDIEAVIADSVQSNVSQAGTDGSIEDHVFELHDISVRFPDGTLSVITGPTASGKTALLLALLGEMTLLPGGKILMHKDNHRVYENGLTHSISYAAQSPWLQHQSIKDNILFGSPYEASRYAQVLDACALRPDLTIFEDGDETEIGARGVSLSGGQKARVALARAVYARTKFVLLDDPLSAVDSHTARQLFEKLLMGPLLKDRTVILVTHHVELVLPGAYYLVRMLDGRIDVQGTVKELRESGALDAITLEEAIEERHEDEQKPDEGEEREAAEVVQAEIAAETAESEGNPDAHTKKGKKPRKFVKDEEREEGSVKWRIYKTYLKASSYWTWSILVLLIVFMQGLGFSEKFWIKIWGEAYGKDVSTLFSDILRSNAVLEQQNLFPESYSAHHHHFPNSHLSLGSTGLQDKLPPAHEKPLFYVGVYALIGLATVLVSIGSTAIQYTGALHASRSLFSQLLRTVVRATMRWIDVTPSGRILNRFSRDVETIDSNLASSLQSVNQALASFFASIIVIVAVFPSFIIPAVFIGYFYYKLAIGYLNTGRDLRRMESTTRSPVFSGFAELLEGIVTVRAFSAESRFLNNLYGKLDLTLRMFYYFWMTNRWLMLRFDCLSALAVFTTTLFALSYDNRPGWAGWAALCITSASNFANNVYWTCRFWTQLELDLNSVERVVEYLELPQEPPAVIENLRPPAHWPSSSGPNEDRLLEVKDLDVRYAPELPAVLHDVTFTLCARERVGLLGRTGSGKSSLAMSILRFIDPAKGQIIIDGIDITTIGVQDLRSRLTFIPQDATLFSGTIRDNLDPFGDYSDLECLDALRRVQMISESSYVSQRSSRAPSVRGVNREETDATAVDSAESGGSGAASPSRAPSESTTVAENVDGKNTSMTKISLDTEVSAGGLNFSAGQRQLIAMARALLRRSALVILDEATSSIDFATDAKIQQTIREEFSDSLLLTIAHRLRTVIDYDRLVVLDAGRVVEFDTPYNLIRKEGGIFRGMCLKSGNFAELEEAAKTKAA